MLIEIILFILTGIIAGLFSGLLGIGGGAVVVPCLLLIFSMMGMPQQYVMHLASGTSLAIMILTSQATVRAYNRHGRILWSVYRKIAGGVAVGAIIGAMLADSLHSDWLQLFFGVFILAVAIKMFFPLNTHVDRALPNKAVMNGIGFLIGGKSGLLGVGGGAIMVPFLTHYQLPMRNAAGISALISFTVALVGSVTYVWTGQNEVGLPAWSLGYVYVPAMIAVAIPSMVCASVGASLAYRVDVKLLRKIFAGFMLVVGVHMIVVVLWGIVK